MTWFTAFSNGVAVCHCFVLQYFNKTDLCVGGEMNDWNGEEFVQMTNMCMYISKEREDCERLS